MSKKKYLISSLLLILSCIIFCNTRTEEVKTGLYYPEGASEADGRPFIFIDENTLIFSYDLLSSYRPVGSYIIEGDLLTMYDEYKDAVYVFRINGNSLIFQENESSPLKKVNEELGFKIEDQTRFIYNGR